MIPGKIVLTAIVLALFIASCSNAIANTATPKIENSSPPAIEVADERNPDNELEIRYCAEETVRKIEPFRRMQSGMSLAEICEFVGEPDRDVGSGINNFVYFLDDGTAVKIGLTYQSGVLFVYQYVKNHQGEWEIIEIVAANY